MLISDWSSDVCSSDLTRIGPVTARLYGEMEAEDEDNIIIDKFARMAGAKFSGPLGGGGASWELGGEWTDTYAWELTTGDRQPGIVYRNFRSEEHTSELQSLMRISYAVFCLKTQTNTHITQHPK